MSYTMTMDMPQSAAAYIERRGPRYRSELTAIMIAIVTSQMNSEPCASVEESTSARLDSFVRGLPKLSGKPYRFHRADAYDEELASQAIDFVNRNK